MANLNSSGSVTQKLQRPPAEARQRTLAVALERTLAEARRLYEAKNYSASAQSYRHCAQLQTQLADFAINQQAKACQLEVAKTYTEIAERLDQKPTGRAREPDLADNYQGPISSLIIKTTTTWDDIGNLIDCKQAIQTAYALALVKRPAGVQRRAVDKILLYGPPGTGKTMLAAAASHELEATFFSVKVSELLSKWFGESSRLISALYTEAAQRAPSVIFLEEFDALAPARDESESGVERRIVSTLLAELDGLNRHVKEVPYVLTIAATNVPWMIDKPILERFGARLIYIPLPDEAARNEILLKHLQAKGYQLEVPIDELASRTKGFSGRDLVNLCSLAIERMELEANPEILKIRSREKLQAYQLQIHPLRLQHFDYAFRQVVPRTTTEDTERFEQWRQALED